MAASDDKDFKDVIKFVNRLKKAAEETEADIAEIEKDQLQQLEELNKTISDNSKEEKKEKKTKKSEKKEEGKKDKSEIRVDAKLDVKSAGGKLITMLSDMYDDKKDVSKNLTASFEKMLSMLSKSLEKIDDKFVQNINILSDSLSTLGKSLFKFALLTIPFVIMSTSLLPVAALGFAKSMVFISWGMGKITKNAERFSESVFKIIGSSILLLVVMPILYMAMKALSKAFDALKDSSKGMFTAALKISASLIVLALGIVAFSAAMIMFAAVNFLDILKLGFLFVVIWIGTKLMGSAKTLFAAAVMSLSLIIIGIGLMFITGPLAKFSGDITWGAIFKFTTFMLLFGLVMLAAGFAVGLIALGSLELGFALIMIGIGLMIFTKPFANFSEKLSWKSIFQFNGFLLTFGLSLALLGMVGTQLLVGAIMLSVSMVLIGLTLPLFAKGFGKWMAIDQKKAVEGAFNFLKVIGFLAAAGVIMAFIGFPFLIGSLMISAGLWLLAKGMEFINPFFAEFNKNITGFADSMGKLVDTVLEKILKTIDVAKEAWKRLKNIFNDSMTPQETEDALEKNKKIFKRLIEVGLSVQQENEIKEKEGATSGAIAAVGRMLSALTTNQPKEFWEGDESAKGKTKWLARDASFIELLKDFSENYEKSNMEQSLNQIAKMFSMVSGITTGNVQQVQTAQEVSTDTAGGLNNQIDVLKAILEVVSTSYEPIFATAKNTEAIANKKSVNTTPTAEIPDHNRFDNWQKISK